MKDINEQLSKVCQNCASEAERTCANCREWFINGIGERECLQTSCEGYSDWVERPKSSEE